MTASPTWILLGAGGHARSVCDAIARSGGVVVAVAGRPGGPAWSVPVMADDEAAIELALAEGHRVALGVGSTAARVALMDLLARRGAVAPAVVATTATTALDCVLGDGAVVLEHAHVGPMAWVGRGVIINTAAVVEHDCRVGDAAHIAPGAIVLGAASIGAGAMVGAGARILPGVHVGEGAVVGAGAVVRDTVGVGRTVVGVPARESTVQPADPAAPRP